MGATGGWQTAAGNDSEWFGIRNGELWSWDASSSRDAQQLRVDVGPWEVVKTGYTHTCGIANGYLYCWGSNDRGQLGTGNRDACELPTMIAPRGDWSDVAPGEDHTCGINEGVLYCWGMVGEKQRGDDRLYPQRVAPGNDWRKVDAGGDTACALRDGGHLRCRELLFSKPGQPAKFVTVGSGGFPWETGI